MWKCLVSVGLFCAQREIAVDAGEGGSTSPTKPKGVSICRIWVLGLHCTPQPSVPHPGPLEGSGGLRKNRQTSKVLLSLTAQLLRAWGNTKNPTQQRRHRQARHLIATPKECNPLRQYKHPSPSPDKFPPRKRTRRRPTAVHAPPSIPATAHFPSSQLGPSTRLTRGPTTMYGSPTIPATEQFRHHMRKRTPA